MASQNMDKKIKSQLPHYAYIDAMAVTVINDRKTAHKHSSFAPFQVYHNIKKLEMRGKA